MNIKKIVMSLLISSSVGLLLVGCTQAVKPGDYDAAEVGKLKKVSPGVIVSMRPVNIRNKADANGGDAPGTENTIVRAHGFEYVIKMTNGAIISLVQTDETVLKVKEHVLVIYGDNTRIVPDNGSEEY